MRGLVKGACTFDRGDWDCKLRLRGWISVLVAFQQVAEREVKLFAAIASPWVIVSCQKEGLCHVTEGFFHSLESNLARIPEDSRTHPCGKGKEIGLLGWL